MPVGRLRVTLLCIGAFLAGAGTTLALVGAFAIPPGTSRSTHVTVAALPVVMLGLALLLGALLLDRARARHGSSPGRSSVVTDGHTPDRPR